MSNDFWVQVIIAISAIVTTYLTTKHGPKLTGFFRGDQKIDDPWKRYNLLFDSYERTIKAQREDLSLKDNRINKLEKVCDNMQDELNKSRDLIAELRDDNKNKQKTIQTLETSINSLRKKFDSSWGNGTP